MIDKIIPVLKNRCIQLAIAFVVTLLAYSNSFKVPFHFDDKQQIVFKESNHSLQQYSKIENWFHINQRPVSSFTLTINYMLGGNNVRGYHIVNLLIHFASGLFLFFLLNLLLAKELNETRKTWLPFVVTIFFLIQPVQTQAVTYIVQRMTSLAGMFVILSVFLYVKGRIYYLNKRNFKAGILYIGAAFLSGILGVLSKQNAAIFPLLFLLIELLFIRTNEDKLCKKYLIISASFLVVISIVYTILFGLPYETKAISRAMYFATQMTVIPRYFQMMLIPFGLSIDHGVKVVEGIFSLKVILGTIFLLGIIIYAIRKVKSQPILSFGIFWIFISLLVESSIFPISDVMFDHRMYLPLAGFSLALWSLVFNYTQLKKSKLLLPIAAFILLLMATGTFARNNTWQSKVKMWKKVTEMYPDYFRAWQGLGREYVSSGEKNVQLIIRSYEKALEIKPGNEIVMNDLAANYVKGNKLEKGTVLYEKLVDSNNKLYQLNALRFLGVYHLHKKELDLAESYFKKLFEINSNDTTALLGLSSLNLQLENYNETIKYGRKYNSLAPGNKSLLFNMGLAYLKVGNPDKAISFAQELHHLEPENINAMLLYANASVNKKDYPSAIRSLEMAYEVSKNERYLGEIEKVKKKMER